MNTKEAFKNESPFVRVGTTLYKIVSQPRLEKPRDFDPFGQAGFAHLWLQYD